MNTENRRDPSSSLEPIGASGIDLPNLDQTTTARQPARRRYLSVLSTGALGSLIGLAGCASPQLALEWHDNAIKPAPASKIIVLAQHPDAVIARVSEDLMSEAIDKIGVAAVAGWRLLPDRNAPPDEQTLKLVVTQAQASHVLLLQAMPPQQRQQLAPVSHGGLGYWGPYRRWYGTTVWTQVSVTTITTSASLYDAASNRMLWGASHVSSQAYGLRPELETMVQAFLAGLQSRQWLPGAGR
ncbi:MAG: hypothetical protein EBT36_02855 [Betaproteobacteria bacterium]|jgi:hypothetical protein|nr:hypothetical protein [Pseudomonadota bacterium]NBO02971.1 hypothetical protein [Betaproteobacteria bacterium]NBO94708.1 hypothetical protein [Betaproteobacteria bacterium]NBP34989.1 hypothetical protein [Betaproteobacteria bacterium]NBQ77059.1 hypothetical protein [Betaproteobacteria bacterium]